MKLKNKLKTKGIIKMNISPVGYNTNKNKNLSFQMKMTPDTLSLIEKAGLDSRYTEMVQDLLSHKGSDSLTAKIVQKGKEFIFGLQHEKYNEAREIFPRNWENEANTYFEKFEKLDEHPHVSLYQRTPSKKYESEQGDSLIKSEVYNKIDDGLENVVKSVHHEIFNGEKFENFINNILKPRHDENIKLVGDVHKEYQEINELIKKGQESGRLDEKATKAIQEFVDNAYNGGKLHQNAFPFSRTCGPEGQHMTLENNLTSKWYKEQVGALVNNSRYRNSIITVEEQQHPFNADVKDKVLFSRDSEDSEKLKRICDLDYYLANR